MSEHGGTRNDDQVGQVVEAARRLVEAYRQQTTSKDDFERLADAIEGLEGVEVSVPDEEAVGQPERVHLHPDQRRAADTS